jgi:hypothetical protein
MRDSGRMPIPTNAIGQYQRGSRTVAAAFLAVFKVTGGSTAGVGSQGRRHPITIRRTMRATAPSNITIRTS